MLVDIGSSEAPAVLGVSSFLTPWALYARKVGLIPDVTEETEVMKRGRQLEGAVLTMFVQELEGALILNQSPETTRWNQGLPWLRATPDALLAIGNDVALVEIKCCVGHPPTTPRVEWIVQAIHQRLAYPEATRQYVVAFGNLSLSYWELPLHSRAMDRVLREEERFLERVIKQDPPPVRAADASVLGKAWPITTSAPVELDESMQAIAEKLARLRSAAKVAADVESQCEAELKAALADHEEGVFPNGGRITWKPYTRKGYMVADQTVRRLTIRTNGGNGE